MRYEKICVYCINNYSTYKVGYVDTALQKKKKKKIGQNCDVRLAVNFIIVRLAIYAKIHKSRDKGRDDQCSEKSRPRNQRET